jgi:hypothetical protein
MPLRPLAARLLLALLPAALLAACAQPPDEVIRCPRLLIPLDTERLTRFADGDGRDITDVVLQAEVKFLSGECDVDEDEITMEFPIAVRGSRGPAERDGQETVDVFMHVYTADRQTRLSSRDIPLSLEFAGNRTSIVAADRLTVRIPKQPDQDADDFVVFLGLKLSREELNYNREESRN